VIISIVQFHFQVLYLINSAWRLVINFVFRDDSWKSKLKLPAKDMRIKTTVSILSSLFKKFSLCDDDNFKPVLLLIMT
jgi:hypothetical protein